MPEFGTDWDRVRQIEKAVVELIRTQEKLTKLALYIATIFLEVAIVEPIVIDFVMLSSQHSYLIQRL
jgi:hypothetical protein